jgi:hypothetical protein
VAGGAAGGVAGARGRSGLKIIYRFTYPNPWWSSRRRMATPEAAMTLEEILELVGPLDHSPGAKTAKDRFRGYLARSVTTPSPSEGGAR